MRYWLLPCTKIKRDVPSTAATLYSPSQYWSALFRFYSYSVEQWEDLRKHLGGDADRAFVVSAKHGLLPLDSDELIEPYDLSVTDLTPLKRGLWVTKVKEQLVEQIVADDYKPHKLVWMVPKTYQRHLLKMFEGFEVPTPLLCVNNHAFPFEGLRGIGAIKQFCNEYTSKRGKTEEPHLQLIETDPNQLELFGGGDK